MPYTTIPAVDESYRFPPAVRSAAANSTENVNKVNGLIASALAASPAGEQAIRYCYLAITSNLPIANSAEATISWNREIEDPQNLHTTTTPQRITCNLAGLYVVNILAQINSGEGRAGLIFRKNGEKVFDRPFTKSYFGGTFTTQTDIVRLAVGDYLTVSIINLEGSTVSVLANAAALPVTTFTIARIGS